jgi:hypothetical protein
MHYVSSEKMPDHSGRLFRFPAASCFSPVYRLHESGKYGATIKKRLRYRQAPIDPPHPQPSESRTAGKSNNNKPAHPHYCSGNPG